MKVYIAGKWKERERIREWMKDIEKLGYEITEDWTRHVKEQKDGEYAIADAIGVQRADVLIVCMERSLYEYKGALIEIGVAIGYGVPVIIVGSYDIGVFRQHPLVRRVLGFDDAIRCLDVIRWWRRGR